MEYLVLYACVQSAESTYLNISNIQYTQVILELSSQLLFPSKRSTRLRRLPFFFNLFVLFSWPCSTSFGRTKEKKPYINNNKINNYWKKYEQYHPSIHIQYNSARQLKLNSYLNRRHTDKIELIVCNSYLNPNARWWLCKHYFGFF